jgi:CBS domain-containing protein
VRVAELLSKKGDGVVTIKPDAPMAAAIARLVECRIGALVVSSDDKAVEGIISERDVVRALHQHGSAVADEPLASVMSSRVHTCSPDDTVESLMAVMTNQRIRHIPVVREGVLAGMVSIGDVVKNRMDELQQDREALMEYINAR